MQDSQSGHKPVKWPEGSDMGHETITHDHMTDMFLHTHDHVTDMFLHTHDHVTDMFLHTHDHMTDMILHTHDHMTDMFLHTHDHMTDMFLHTHDHMTCKTSVHNCTLQLTSWLSHDRGRADWLTLKP